MKQPAAATPFAEMTATGTTVVPEEPLKPHQCRKHLRNTVAAAYRDIVAGFVNEAKSGSCQHLKMATEVVASKKREQTSRGKGTAALMLEELERG